MNRIGEIDPRSARQREELFARRVGRLLDASIESIDAEQIAQLAIAREAAVRAYATAFPGQTVAVGSLSWARNGAASAVAGGGNYRLGWARTSLVIATLALVGSCLVGLFQSEQRRRIDEQAEIEAALLADDLPISAYADHGFNAFVKQNQ